ncbi:MAG: S8 family serine peptidase, partial [Ignavibacteria bacterium]|nr:S8 family serine peptidase [Ignavibacteria bacterium]
MKIKMILFLSLICLFYAQVFPQNGSFSAISLSTCKVDKFLSEHPNFDGRGTIIIIVDTGLDFNVPGLQKTSTGETKIIDVQDFTGQGDVFVNEVELKEIGLQGIEQLKLKPIDGKYFKGYFEEKIFQNSNSGLKDINGNGKSDDKFGFVVFKANDKGEVFDVVFIDTNLDNNLLDEKPIRNYKEKFDVLEFQMKDKNDKAPISFGINIFLQERRVSFFFDDGGHGTHVAGIAAGYRINDQDGYNGIAPGVQLIGLKIGNNNLAGGSSVTLSMFKAYEYANKISREKKVPVIVNM